MTIIVGLFPESVRGGAGSRLKRLSLRAAGYFPRFQLDGRRAGGPRNLNLNRKDGGEGVAHANMGSLGFHRVDREG